MATIAQVIRTEIGRAVSKQLHEERVFVEVKRIARQLERMEKRLAALEAGGVNPVAKAVRPRTGSRRKVDKRKLRFSSTSLRNLRKKLGVTQGELSKLLKVSSNSVWQWEAGRAKPRAGTLELIRKLRSLGKREAKKRLAKS